MKRKLKNWVIPSIYVLIIIASFFSISLIHNFLTKDINNYNYSKSLMKEITQDVFEQTNEDIIEISKPIVNENVFEKISYYSKDDSKEHQEQSIIHFQNTYYPSTGIFYASEDVFDILAIYDGIVAKVGKDELLGNYLEIKHNENLSTFYYSIDNIELKENEEVQMGTIIGKSTSNKIYEGNNFFFEVHYKGKTINPHELYEKPLNNFE